MYNNDVGAGILSIITESLYDNPIVVFREYVQNSVDSLLKSNEHTNSKIKIWESKNNLFFLDNGKGIETKLFHEKMRKIGDSSKKKHKNLGYKGIGRLSGVPYCKELIFLNIYDYKKLKAQRYSINSVIYNEIKNGDSYLGLSFSELMNKIGNFSDIIDWENPLISDVILKYEDMLKETNTGFLVILKGISDVLKNTIKADGFFRNLQWLLPVDFEHDLYESSKSELFKDLNEKNGDVIPVRSFDISYNDNKIFRPIKEKMLRDFVCKNNFKYAIGFNTFKKDKIAIDKSNDFRGIRIYIDNMLLCDENELLQNLDNYNLLRHTLNGQLQSVRGVGAMIYITDKVNISANARRTFIEVTDNDSLEFMELLAEFVNNIYDARYSLSNYASAKVNDEKDKQELKQLEEKALNDLRKLAKEDVEIVLEEPNETEFKDKEIYEQRQIIKKKISTCINQKIKDYLKVQNSFDLESAYEDFYKWLKKNQ